MLGTLLRQCCASGFSTLWIRIHTAAKIREKRCTDWQKVTFFSVLFFVCQFRFFKIDLNFFIKTSTGTNAYFFRFFLKTDKVPVWKGSDPNPNCGLDTDSNWGKFWDLDSNRMYLDPHPWSPLHTHFIFTSGKVTFWIAKMSGVGRFSASFSIFPKR